MDLEPHLGLAAYARGDLNGFYDLADAIEHILSEGGCASHQEPERVPDPAADFLGHACWGRSRQRGIDQQLVQSFLQLGGGPHLALLARPTQPVCYLPLLLDAPRHGPTLSVGSSLSLQLELQTLAPPLGLRLGAEGVSDSLACSINDLEELRPGEDRYVIRRERPGWLLLHEAGRLGEAHGCAVIFAG